MSNPLLEIHQLPPFSRIKPAHVEPALSQVLAENRAMLNKFLHTMAEVSWDGFVTMFEDLQDRLCQLWSPISHLNSVANDETLRVVYNEALTLLTAYYTELSQHQKLFESFNALKNSADFINLSTAQKKFIENELRDFHLSGVDLPEDKKQRWKELQEQQSRLVTRFEEHVLDATHAWSKEILDETLLQGLPAHAISLAKQTAQEMKKVGCVLTLDMPCYISVMQHAEHAALREEMYYAYVTRASEQGPHAGRFDNSTVMLDILKIRLELSQLLGFADFADYSLQTKMAREPQRVLNFLNDLATRIKPQAEKEMAVLREFAKQEYGVLELQPWDMLFYSEKLRLKQYEFSQEDVRPYFQVNAVLSGLFDCVRELYGLHILKVRGVDVWHPDVEFYEVRDACDQLRGYFYTDLYVRPHKRAGAWMDECRNRRKVGEAIQFPVAYLTCNFAKPVGKVPALFTHDDVVTLFHEFGHTLHHVLTTVDVLGVSGIHGVAWDAVELPSQFMENWCFEKSILKKLSCHYETGESIPDELFEKMIKARNFQSALSMARQLEFSLFDFHIHRDFKNYFTVNDIQAILEDVRVRIRVAPVANYNRFAHSFSHIFAGGYAAGYYSYVWAEVLSSDAYARFEEEGLFNTEVAHQFLTTILEQGGGVDMDILFERFRGRPPKMDALLRHRGIINTTNEE